jgi:hypothetical protein
MGAAPTRVWAVGAATNPQQTPVFVAGGGVTPLVGLRLGAAFAHGDYATADEVTVPPRDGRAMTMVGGEGEWAFGGTKVGGEIVRTAFDTLGGTSSIAYEWFVQGQHTLTPRWFGASRYEGTSAPPLVNGIVPGRRSDLQVVEATAGYRLSPDFTLRGSYVQRRTYGAATWLQQAGASIVWTHRWW